MRISDSENFCIWRWIVFLVLRNQKFSRSVDQGSQGVGRCEILSRSSTIVVVKKPMPRIDEYSRAAVPIVQLFDEMVLGNASAFVWFENGNHYLITNWHVVTMTNPITGVNLHREAARPNKLRAQFNSARAVWEKHTRDIPLLDADDRPLWFVHPAHKQGIDVVAILLPTADHDLNYYPINRMTRERELAIRIGMDVFVLGYPFGASPPGFPIWKRGSIASEPELAGVGHKYFLIDSASDPVCRVRR
jgi:hypothetical protein